MPIKINAPAAAAAEIVVCGRRAVAALLEAKRVKKLYVDANDAPAVALCGRAAGVVAEKTTRQRLSRLADGGRHGGVIAVAAPPVIEWSVLLRQQRRSLILLDGVTDPRNLGALMRVARAFAAAAVIAPRRRCAPLSAAAVRASAGAAAYLPLVRVANIRRALQQLRDAGWTTVAADEEGETVWPAALASAAAVCWVFGDEGGGVRRLTRVYCDFALRVPTVAGEAGCLNVVSACTALLAAAKMREMHVAPG